MNLKTPQLPVFLFDADCGVCQNGTDSIRARMDPPVAIVPFQSIDYAALGVTDGELAEGPVFVSETGQRAVGPAAMAELLLRSRHPYRAIGAAIRLPGIRHALHALGPVMYRHRDRLPGATPACSVTAPER